MFRLLAAAALCVPAAVTAAETPWARSGNLSVVSDYRFRGISQSSLRPALQGGLDFAHAVGGYVGTWASSVAADRRLDARAGPGETTTASAFSGSPIEWDVYGGWRGDLPGGVMLDVGAIRYGYPGAVDAAPGRRFDTVELFAGASLANASIKLNYAISSYFGLADSRGALYLDLGYLQPLARRTSLIAHLGRLRVPGAGAFDATDWRLGFTTEAWQATWGLALVGSTASNAAYRVGRADGGTRDVGRRGLILSVGTTF